MPPSLGIDESPGESRYRLALGKVGQASLSLLRPIPSKNYLGPVVFDPVFHGKAGNDFFYGEVGSCRQQRFDTHTLPPPLLCDVRYKDETTPGETKMQARRPVKDLNLHDESLVLK